MRLLAAALLATAIALVAVVPARAARPTAPATRPASPPVGIRVGPPLPVPAPASPDRGEVAVNDPPDSGAIGTSDQVRAAVDDWFRGLVEDALRPSLALVGRTLLAAPALTGQPMVRTCWQVTLGIADGLLLVVIVIAGAILIGHETYQSRYTVKHTLPRLLFAAIAANASLATCGQLTGIANALATGLLFGGVDPATASAQLAHDILRGVADGGTFRTLLGLACMVLAVLLLVLCIARVAVVVLLVCAGPLMLLAHALPQTEGLAHVWWRALTAALGVQLAQALILTAAVKVFFTPAGHGLLGLPQTGSVSDLLVALCVLSLLVGVAFCSRRFAFSTRPSRATLLIRSVLLMRGLREAGALV
jgi:hypothetical protein